MSIYLDYNASTPLDPEVVETIKPFLFQHYGNPSSHHWAGKPAHDAIVAARQQVANLLGATPEEIVFTSGGSESNNFALKGVIGPGEPPLHFITCAVEHPAIIKPLWYLEKLGASVTIVPVDSTGRVDPEDVREAIRPETRMITVMHANNEVGTLQPVREIAAIAREHGVLCHTDAAQSVGKVPVRVDELGVDMLTVAGHKVYAPKGVGALYLRKGLQLEPLIHGAGHESGRRASTENTIGIVALGKACELAANRSCEPIRELRDNFWSQLQSRFGDNVVRQGHPEHCLPNTLNVCFRNRVGSQILSQLGDVAASTGSACHSGSVTLSPVLEAMGVTPEVGMGAIRFSLGRFSTPNDIDEVIRRLQSMGLYD